MIVDLNTLHECYHVGVKMLIDRIILLDKWVYKDYEYDEDNPYTQFIRQAQKQELITNIHIFKNLTRCLSSSHGIIGYKECLDIIDKVESE